MTTETKKEFKRNEGIFALWAGLLLPAAAWAAQQQALYTMVPWACVSGHGFALHLVSLAAVLSAAAGGLLSWRKLERAGADLSDDERGGAIPRSHFLAVLGVASAAFFALVMIAQWLGTVILHPCDF